MNTRDERRARQEAEFNAEYEKRQREVARKAALTMWERIEEAEASDDVKDILHRIAVHVGLEDA